MEDGGRGGGQAETRRTFAVVDNIIGTKSVGDKRSGGQDEQERTAKGATTAWPGSPVSSESGSSSRSVPMTQMSPTHLHEHHQDHANATLHSSSSAHSAISSNSLTDGKASSITSNASNGLSTGMASRHSHSNLSASLLTPTLASALGIIPSARRRRRALQKQATAPTSYSSASNQSSAAQVGWSRRPSLPTLSGTGAESRTSMYSVASFESLPEGEAVSHMPSSPRSPYHPLHPDRCDMIAEGSSSSSGSFSERANAVSTDHLWTKRANVAKELLETERAFVISLRIINEHYYQPLLALSRGITPSSAAKAVANAAPVLSRKAINEIFSNFADILHLNSELLTRLDDRLSGRNRDPPNSRPVSLVVAQNEPDLVVDSECDAGTAAAASTHLPWNAQEDRVGDLLASFAPFLKMYSFYVKNFSSALNRIEVERRSNESFARFLKETERITWMTNANGRPNGFGFGLGLQAHLLTIVQRIPRYKLLVGELVKCTPMTHKDALDLMRAFQVIEQVAESINDNIRQHEMVLSMLDIQRTLVGLTDPLIVPGRSLLKRATMLKAGRKDIHPREFFLFSDCIVYAAPIGNAMADASAAWYAFSRYGGAGDGTSSPIANPALIKRTQTPLRSASPDKGLEAMRKRTFSVPTQVDSKRVSFSVLEGQQLQFRGKFALQDCTVVGVDDATSSDPALRHYFEIRTPGKSFAVYADSAEVKLDWLSAIRNAREELMSNRRTLQAEEDSIAAKRDRRRSLQATGRQVSFPRTSDTSPSSIPEGASVNAFDDPVRSRRESLPSFTSTGTLVSYLGGGGGGGGGHVGHSNAMATSINAAGMRGGLKVLEEYNAPVWVPDSRADKCARCNEGFGLWRRKHHCRLCGQVVCWACSQKTFLIASYEEGEQDRPARACDSCYESVFPESPLEHPQAHNDGPERSTNSGDDVRASQALDSDASAPSCPPTPTSPQPPYIVTTEDKRSSVTSLSSNVQTEERLSSPSITSPPALRHRSVSPPTRQAPAARIAKAHVSNAQVFRGQMPSPQVHAATSGTGTFRLVTPRLTTPEHERPPLIRWPQSHGQQRQAFAAALNEHSAEDGDPLATPISSNPPPAHESRVGDYFAGAVQGQSELPVNDAQHAAQPFPLLMPRRKKVISAAARLSSVYSALPPLPSGGAQQQQQQQREKRQHD